MASYNRSLIYVALSAIASWGIALSTAAYDVIAWVLLDPLKLLFKADHRHVELTHALHDTRADDVRRNTPFRAFIERAREMFGFNGHFHPRMIAGT